MNRRGKDRGTLTRPGRAGSAQRLALAALAATLAPLAHTAASAQSPPASSRPGLSNVPLEELLKIEVTLAARTGEVIGDAAAAVHVVTYEDLRRSGVSSIAEALRLVPGIQVAQVNASKWAVTARGFNSRFANKLQVLLDGRSVYTPLFSGVDWESLDVPLEDVERIEVIRGPGATLWGSNAVNGVINIVTRNAASTRGGFLSAEGSEEDPGLGTLRYGGGLAGGHYRAYARGVKHDGYDPVSAQPTDAWKGRRAGFRFDRDTAGGSLSLQANAYDDETGQFTTVASLSTPYTASYDETTGLSGQSVQGSWKRRLTGGSTLALQASLEHMRREISILEEERGTYDLDFQHELELGDGHDLLWGAGYRLTRDRTQGSSTVRFDPGERSFSLASAFVQYVERPSSRWEAAVGSKFELNDYTGFEFQPSARALWKPAAGHTLWGAVSRAVRTPSRANVGIVYDVAAFDAGGGSVAVVRASGNPEIEAENLTAYEAGWRVQPSPGLSIDMTAFYNRYNDLIGSEPQAPVADPAPGAPDTILPMIGENRLNGRSLGAEVAFNWRPSRRWSLMGWYAYFDLRLKQDPGSAATTNWEGNDPRHQAHLRSYLDLPSGLAFDMAAWYVDDLDGQSVPDYVRLDARLAWHRPSGFELSVGGRNLLDERHPEFVLTEGFEGAAEVERTYYARLAWWF
jgi:iron complex outermembrane receptor protein